MIRHFIARRIIVTSNDNTSDCISLIRRIIVASNVDTNGCSCFIVTSNIVVTSNVTVTSNEESRGNVYDDKDCSSTISIIIMSNNDTDGCIIVPIDTDICIIVTKKVDTNGYVGSIILNNDSIVGIVIIMLSSPCIIIDCIDCNNNGGTSIGVGGVYGSNRNHLLSSSLSLPLFGYCFTFSSNNNASSSASSFIHHVSCNPHTDDVLLGSVPKSLVLQSQDL